MVKKLLFSLLLMLSIHLVAQTTQTTQTTQTVTIDWGRNSTPSATGDKKASRTIEIGDTVIWNWYSSGSHNVDSAASATESFESSYFGNGGTFSYTFTSIGSK